MLLSRLKEYNSWISELDIIDEKFCGLRRHNNIYKLRTAVGPGTLVESFDSSCQVRRPTSRMMKNICKNAT